jgi:hypothetical protein
VTIGPSGKLFFSHQSFEIVRNLIWYAENRKIKKKGRKSNGREVFSEKIAYSELLLSLRVLAPRLFRLYGLCLCRSLLLIRRYLHVQFCRRRRSVVRNDSAILGCRNSLRRERQICFFAGAREAFWPGRRLISHGRMPRVLQARREEYN